MIKLNIKLAHNLFSSLSHTYIPSINFECYHNALQPIKLVTKENKCLHRMLKVSRKERFRNKNIW
uniref:Uncharacterized protein n=1 Tax=Arion vulgaris TaxID=1028688 RepID=A0A0B7ACY1_9EUPU